MKKSTLALFIYLTLIALLITGITCKAQTPGTWQPNKKYIASKQDSTVKKHLQQCWGTTKKGIRCKRKIANVHDYCYQHAGQK